MGNIVWNGSNNEYKPNVEGKTNKDSSLVRLVEDPEIKKNIQFDELSIATANATPDGGSSQVGTVGLTYPIIKINDIVFGQNDIISMSIVSDSFLPTISLTVQYSNSSVISKNMPKDGDIISVFCRTNTDAINYIRNDYIITSCNGTTESGKTKAFFTGSLFIEGIDSTNNVYAVLGTSKDVMKETAKRFNIGFAYNDSDDMNDTQNWVCCDTSPIDFVSNVTEHCWKDSMSFFKSWIDIYYNLCFVNVNKFLLSDSNPEDEIDITFGSNTSEFAGIVPDNKDTTVALKIFTNDPVAKGTPFFIKKWRPRNNSQVSRTVGYSNTIFSYVHNQNVYTNNKDYCCETLKIEPAYDPNKVDSYILLRGRAKYSKENNPANEQERVNSNVIKTYSTKIWTGVEYKMNEDEDKENNNTWSGNIHQNYNNAVYCNSLNRAELEKLYIVIECEGLCLQVMRGERVPVYIMYNDAMDRTSAPRSTNAEFNKFYTGYYIVDEISYEYNVKTNDGYGPFTTKMTLKRREWPAPEAIKKDNDVTNNE